jgi:1-phosphofructokinase
MSQEQPRLDAVTVTLNPAIDRTVTISNFAAGKVNRVEVVSDNPGGKGVNVASALADYGRTVAVTGFLGADNAASFESLFQRKSIADRFVRIPGRTRVGIKITDPVQSQTTDINFPGPEPAPGALEGLRKEIEALDAPWFVLAGSLPPGVDAGIYGEFVTALKARGRGVLLDTSGDPLQGAVEAAPRIVKPNIHELEDLLGRPLAGVEEILAAGRKLIALGIELVAVSMGRDGACFVTAEDAVIAVPPDIEVKSTVGAGDAMVAGILAGQIRGLGLGDCARLATAFSLDALSRLEPGVTSPEAIEAAMASVTLSHP